MGSCKGSRGGSAGILFYVRFVESTSDADDAPTSEQNIRQQKVVEDLCGTDLRWDFVESSFHYTFLVPQLGWDLS